MFDLEIAAGIARKTFAVYEKRTGVPLELDASLTRTLASGWVFFFNFKEFLETGNESAQLYGNGALFVSKLGEVIQCPTYESWEDHLAKAGLM